MKHHANWTVNQPIAAQKDCQRISGPGNSTMTDVRVATSNDISVAALVPSARSQSMQRSIAQYCRRTDNFSFNGTLSSPDSHPWKSRLLSNLYRRSSAIDSESNQSLGIKSIKSLLHSVSILFRQSTPESRRPGHGVVHSFTLPDP